jgi:thiol-disulfide isomerase/thioredoxin
MNKLLLTVALACLSLAVFAQDTPQDIAKKDLPKLAKCFICTDDGDEKPAGGVMYKGKAYYFCNANEIKAFKKDPEAYIPAVVPREMPAFELKDETGKLWNADAMKGKLVLIDFWATWCKPCIAMFPMVHKLREKNASKGFEVLSVSIDESRPELDKFLKKHSFSNPVLHDTAKTWNAFSIKLIPAMYLVRDGKIVAQWIGKTSEKELAAAIEANLPK